MIDPKFKSEKVQKDLRELVLDNYKTVKERAILEQKWRRFYELYRGLRSKGTYKGRADLDWASAFLTIEILVPRIYNALFPRVKWFDITGVELSDEKQAQIMAAYLRQKLERDISFRRKMIPTLRYCGIFGTTICKTPFRFEEKTVPKKTVKKLSNFYGTLSPEYTNEKVTTFDSIDLELVDIFDFFPSDDFIATIEDQPFVIHRTVEYESLLFKKKFDKAEGTGIYENLDKIKLEEGSHHSPDNQYRNSIKSLLGYKTYTAGKTMNTVEFIEYQGVYEEEDIVVIVANDSENQPIVSAEPLNTPDKEKTFVMGKWIDIPNEFWGMSIIERIEKPIYELNDRVNQTMDTASQIINPMYLSSDADIIESTLNIFPGRIINVSTEKGLTALHPPVEVLVPGERSIQALVAVIQDISGATRFLGGSAQTPELQRTATGIMSIIKEANARLNLTVQGFEDSFTIRFLRRAYKYTQFYATRKDIVRIVGKQGIEYQEVDPATIIEDYDFRALGSQTIGTEEILTQQLINYLNIIIKIPGVIENFDVLKLASKIGERMLGLDDLDELILRNNREEEEREKAISENMMAMEGIPPVISANDNHRLHIEIHNGFELDERSQELPRAVELLHNHSADHEKYEKGQGAMPMYNPGNMSQPSGQGQAGVPHQEQPRGTSPEGMVKQISQPSQEGTI